MRKDNFKGLMILGLLVGIIGLLLVLFSNNLGKSLADGWFVEYDYALSTYESKVKTNTNIFLVIGSILSGIGFSTVVFSFYKMLNIKDKEHRCLSAC